MPLFGLLLLVSGLAASPLRAQGPSLGYAELGYPPAIGKPVLAGLLQRVVDRLYMKGFRHLGDERDFDHGHFLFDASGRPLAILYHMQELALHEPRGSEFGYLDPAKRNWIQWLGDGRIENAERYLRKSYPKTAEWDWFREAELPDLEENHTILDKMLDPALVGLDPSKTKQWVFTRIPCEAGTFSPDSADIRVVLPTKQPVCLALAGA
ncbi:MAG TPA: hypothetical protein VH309_08430 [Elusimicrobiota bacterium]|jgi:hypothetical protein|nr:hypothetical protein [Elusimicrobiota bacterium]